MTPTDFHIWRLAEWFYEQAEGYEEPFPFCNCEEHVQNYYFELATRAYDFMHRHGYFLNE